MQTLTAGSFLNLENAETVEALKFTARRLAEMTTAVVAENLTFDALRNLANDLWQKAEYVARETERRRLHEIFNENFCERFRELKPEVPSAEITSVEAQQNISATENNNTTAQSSSAPVESVSIPKAPEESTTEAQEKKDEFLGFVKSDEPLAESPDTETDVATAAMPPAQEENEQEATQSSPENEPATAAPADAKDNQQPPPASAIKTGAPAAKISEAKEPFEFGKCTVNLSLVLLPSSGDEQSRKAIVSASSHNSPPKIEFLEISEGGNLDEIAVLVRGKLERFKQTLPAKYIEQLRTSKTKSAKKSAPAKPAATPPAPTKPETAQSNAVKTNGSQPARNERAIETEKTEIAATKETLAAQPAPVVAVQQTSAAAANNVQPSLF